MSITPGEFRPIFEEGQRKQRQPYEVMRLQTVPLVNVHLTKTKQIKDQKKIFKFPWDAEYHSKKVDDFMAREIDWDELDNKYGKFFKKKNAKK